MKTKLATWLRRKPQEPEPHTHDWTRRNYSTVPRHDGQELGLVFWSDDGPVPRVGDYLILRNASGSTRYRLTEVGKHLAEGDVCHADAVFAPRTENEE